MTNDPIVAASMQILLGSGDARKLAAEAVAALAVPDFDLSEERLDAAQAKLKAAHAVHTDIIQSEAGGEGSQIGFPVLFSHAQDTMMSTDSEIKSARRLVPVVRGLHDRLAAVEAVLAAEVAR
ncbi:PTS lactose/cellobiose transporter subunit IIA [Demequina pelophila]|uniref:PTS lactose/cellobiose transporter subunit IIA n=1 Tax=Demequina pelophila TaxID=1638984 RepID=UPI0007831ADD|nr:PTS lactose/cellobiose transporter subunit IIA [Demequina pelophila]